MHRFKDFTPDTIEDDGFKIECMASRDAIIVRIQFWPSWANEPIVATETAKRGSDDHFDPEVGFNLAHARAFEVIAKKLMRRAEGRIIHNDQMTEKKAVAKQTKTLDTLIELLEKDVKEGSFLPNPNQGTIPRINTKEQLRQAKARVKVLKKYVKAEKE